MSVHQRTLLVSPTDTFYADYFIESGLTPLITILVCFLIIINTVNSEKDQYSGI